MHGFFIYAVLLSRESARIQRFKEQLADHPGRMRSSLVVGEGSKMMSINFSAQEDLS